MVRWDLKKYIDPFRCLPALKTGGVSLLAVLLPGRVTKQSC